MPAPRGRKAAPVTPPDAPTPLAEYDRKRDFSRTPEPAGAPQHGQGPLTFVVHKHAATRLHYDVRLEWDGVMPSWAVPKGPSSRIGDKHLAVHVEDHPLDYAKFEGLIPKGEYGGGEVIIWDAGTYSPDEGATSPSTTARKPSSACAKDSPRASSASRFAVTSSRAHTRSCAPTRSRAVASSG